jgi:hypothetical protein
MGMIASGVDSKGERYDVPVRRLRVQTVKVATQSNQHPCADRLTCDIAYVLMIIKVDIARSPMAIYDHSSPSMVMGQLTHQIIHASIDRGIDEARNLVKDWLVNLYCCYNVLVTY